MKPFTFVPYDPSQAEEVLPRMFDILSGNMSAIAPTGRSNEEDRETWLAYMASEQGADVLIQNGLQLVRHGCSLLDVGQGLGQLLLVGQVPLPGDHDPLGLWAAGAMQ